MNVETRPLRELLGMMAPYNPRKISPAQLDSLRKSMSKFGVVQPVVVNRQTGTIVGGHQRVRAAEGLALDELPVVYVDLDDEQERLLNVALNKIGGDWDVDMLADVLSSIDEDMLHLTGFSEDELENLFEETDPTEGLSGAPQLPEGLTFKVVVDVDDEQSQAELTARLEEEGYSCKMLIS